MSRLVTGAHAAALIAFAILVTYRIALYGPVHDEYASLWFSDPELTLGQLYRDRLRLDTNPPLYYLILWLIRHFFYLDLWSARLINILALGGCVACVLFVSWRSPNRYLYLCCVIALCLSNGDLIYFSSLARSYSFQISFCLVFCSILASFLLEDGRLDAGRATLLCLSVLVLTNLHFTSALLTGSLAGCAILYLMAHRRWGRGIFIAVVCAIAALPVVALIIANLFVLQGLARDFHVRTDTVSAMAMIGTVIRGSLAHNLVLIVLIAMTFSVIVARRFGVGQSSYVAAAAQTSSRELKIALVFGSGAVVFFLLMLGWNAVQPIVTIRYIAAAAVPLAFAWSLSILPWLRRWPWLSWAILGNAVIWVLLQATAGGYPRDVVGVQALRAQLQKCPDARIYGTWTLLYNDVESHASAVGYIYVRDHYGVPIQLQPDALPWRPARSATCPTILWAAHMPATVTGVSEFVKVFDLDLLPADQQQARFEALPGVASGLLILPPAPAPSR